MSGLTLDQASDTRRPPASAKQGNMVSQYLIFSLGGELFGVGTLRVREIIEWGSLTTVPMMPGYMRGVINLRGSVVPVIDLSARFGRGATEVSRRTCIVILEVQAEDDTFVLGIIVDAVSAVRQIDRGLIEPPPTFGTRIRSDFIDGMAKVNGGFVILLNLGMVLSINELSSLQAMASEDTPLPEGSTH